MADWMWLTGVIGLVILAIGLIGMAAGRSVSADVADYTEDGES